MLTRRAIWMTLTAAGLLLCSVLLRHEPASLTALALLAWVGIEWLRFRLAVARGGRVAAACRRRVMDSHVAEMFSLDSPRSIPLQIDQPAPVTLELEPARPLQGLRIWLEDVLPPGAEASSSPRLVSDVQRDRTLTWSYLLRIRRLGRLQLPGVEARITDRMGLFEHFQFIPCRQELTVLPMLVRPQATSSVLKRKDAQIVSGQHRYRRPGGGGELLSIRDYEPGDPPKTIAWKVSARLGRLMSCEYERETPVRSTIITDLSLYQFVGRPGPAAADRAVAVAASMARLLLSDRDPVASMVINGADRAWLPHGHGERHLTRLLHVLLSHAGSQSAPPGIIFEDLADVTWETCRRRFPELFDTRINPQRGFLRFSQTGSRLRRRQQLALALSQIFDAPLGFAQRLQEDRQEFSRHCRRFLAEHPSDRIPVDAPPAHQLAVSRHRTLRTICSTLTEGVARAKDNELFMVVAAQPVMLDEIELWERAVRMARANYHRVMLLYGDPQPEMLDVQDDDARRILWENRRDAAGQTMEQLRRRMTRLGATLSEFSSPHLAQQVAAELELLGSGRGRKLGSGAR